MTTTLDVLLIEGQTAAGHDDTRRLVSAGHRVHRCFPHREARGRVPLRDRYLCAAVTDGRCPLDDGIDVALLVRDPDTTEPVATEVGVSCALRSGVPVVEDGPDVLDPFEPWVSARAEEDDVVSACERAASTGFAGLEHAIDERLSPILAHLELGPDELSYRFETDGSRLRVVLSGPALPHRAEQSLAVRVLDAVRVGRRSFGPIDVAYEAQA